MPLDDRRRVEFGRYEILGKVAEGGMAEVFVGKLHGASGFTKRYAIKQLRPELSADPDLVQMFFDEARIASSLSHPNICQIFELGEFGGRHFIAMEFLSGLTLSQLWRAAITKKEVLPAHLVAWIIARAGEGLGYAHEKKGEDGVPLGIVHRDVSPDNLMLTEDGEVKVLDFGIARATHRSRRTRTGLVRGKVAYMAPEYIRGEELDGRSDVFALGVVFWELLSGRELFRGQEDVQAMYAVLNPRLPDRPPGNGAPDALWKIAEAALQREPKQRIPSAREMARRIDEALAQLKQPVGTAEVAKLVKVWAAAIPTLQPQKPQPASEALTQPHRPGPSPEPVNGRVPVAATPRQTADVATVRPVTKDVAALTPFQDPAPALGVEVDAPRKRARWPLALAALIPLSAAAVWLTREAPEPKVEPVKQVTVAPAPAPGVVAPAAAPVPEPIVAMPKEDPKPVAPVPAPALKTKRPKVSSRPEHRQKAPPLPAEKLAQGSGRLALDTHPWTKVYLDGHLLGDTPLDEVTVPAGHLRLRAVNAELNLDKVIEVDVTANQVVRVRREW